MDLSRVSIVCYASCYVIALGCELLRVRLRWLRRPAILVVAMAAGLLAHTLHLVHLGWQEWHLVDRGFTVWASWHDWSLLAAWVMAGAYLGLLLRRPQTAVGLFILPLVLILLGAAQATRDWPPFSRQQAVSLWRAIHGGSLLLGTVGVLLGFAAGLMYLVHSYRLKHGIANSRGFQLPPLEWLQRFNRETLWISTAAIALGLISGIVLNLTQPARAVLWLDSVVISSGVLLAWLVAVCVFEAVYKPARQGRKVAYLTLSNFIFLGIVLALVLWAGHGGGSSQVPPASSKKSFRSSTSQLRSLSAVDGPVRGDLGGGQQ